MSVFGLERSQTDGAQAYDHAINLVDTTKPRDSLDEEQASPPSPSSPIPRSDSGTLLSRQRTKGGLQKQLAQRKYAKYQEGKEVGSELVSGSGDESSTGTQISQEGEPRIEGGRTGRLRDKVPFRRKAKKRSREPVDTFIDVLYENQRGSFFCGIPLYSSNSLLNFDPSPWQTANFTDSAVNITNFQLPDPSWVWDWKTWYVDMSHDVDEEGWEYSFSFSSVYSWHGTHPYLFSFVRRRRWLRRRIRIYPHKADGKKGSRTNAHLLNEDYFTIHATRRSRESSAERSTNNPSTLMPDLKGEEEGDEDRGEISNISALMAALRRSRVDREKIAAVRLFLEQGGEELFYLAEKMPEIMAIFVHQTSCRQLQSYLLQLLDEITGTGSKGKDKENGKDNSDTDLAAKRLKIDNLLKAINAAGVHINDLHYWSDLRDRATGSEAGPTEETHALDASEPADVAGDLPHAHSDDDETNVREEIKGIPKDAQVSEEPRIQFATRRKDSSDSQGSATGPLDKGKGKA